MNFTAEQERALDRVGRWLRERSTPWFYLAGFAGTGKTTLARHVAETVDGRVEFAAPTGKAAQVLRRKGCDGATTIHRLIYRASEKCRSKLEELEAKLAAHQGDEAARHGRLDAGAGALWSRELLRLQAEIRQERARVNQPSFGVNPLAELRDAELLILDECSMIDERLAADVLSFRVPVLALGDPAQLPPVRGCGYFTERAPDAQLVDVQRQAAESPVLWLATRVREARHLPLGKHGASDVRRFDELTSEVCLNSEVLLTGHNVTRRNFNLRLRGLAGFAGQLPRKNESLIALRNDHVKGIYNGTTLVAASDAEVAGGRFTIRVRGEDVDEQEIASGTLAFDRYREPELEDLRRPWERNGVIDLDWAYALTVHKSQGSQWNSVVVADDGFASSRPLDRRRWLYTALTRAVDRVTVALS